VNPSFTFTDVPLRHGQIVPNLGWVADDYLAIDQGPIVAMIENYRSGLIWTIMKRNPHIRRGLERAGFSGGWLGEPEVSDEQEGSDGEELGDGSDEGDGGDKGLSFLPTHALERLCSLFPFLIPFALSLSKLRRIVRHNSIASGFAMCRSSNAISIEPCLRNDSTLASSLTSCTSCPA
jgi:hypothetical protein